MSVLAPLYLIGALAIGLPIVFHLIRRRPTGAIEFSSLMFLQPTPPRLTRRSRLENWPLLLLRALALLLMAAAFARPFMRKSESSASDEVGRRLVLVVDQSASMRRPGIWQRAIDDARSVINRMAAKDQFAIVNFDEQPTVLFSFQQSTQLDRGQRKQAALSIIEDLSPTWRSTNMARAISFAADTVSQFESDDAATAPDNQSATANGEATVVLISDMQQGSQIEGLQQYAWPKNLRLQIHRIDPDDPTNAHAQILSDGQVADESDRVRVRVKNASDSQTARFHLAFVENETPHNEIEMPIQVPPGESRVVRMPLPDPSDKSLVLSGDAQTFDNQRFIASPEKEALTLLFLGPDPEVSGKVQAGNESQVRDNLLFYLQRVPLSHSRADVTVRRIDEEQLTVVPPAKTTPLIVVAQSVSNDVAERLQQYVADGGRVLFVLSRPEDKDLRSAIATVSGIDEESFSIDESVVKDYAMLSQIDFAHPVFRPMADPQFNDFTKVRFWSYRLIQPIPKPWSVLANFDVGGPAMMEFQNNAGRAWVLAAGWQPSSSQLALSTKFLPLVFSFFGNNHTNQSAYDSITVGAMPPFAPQHNATITKPDGSEFDFVDNTVGDHIDQPGVYRYNDGETSKPFAVNLAASESDTTALDDEALERFGIKLGKPISVIEREAMKRQLRDIELEKQQKIWQWLLAVALGLLAIETLWSGLISRRGTTNTPSSSTANAST